MIQNWEATNCIVDGVPTLKCFEVVFSNVIFMAGSIIVIVLFTTLFIGGFNYLTSFGKPEQMKKAQQTIMYGVIGFVLFISSYLILRVVDYLFLGNCGRIFQLTLDIDEAAKACP